MAIMSAFVFYVIPGLLGRTYDLKNDTVGPDIFTRDVTANAKKIERYMTISEYRVVSETSEATDFLDVSGKLSLKLKSGSLSLEGAGQYLKESSSFHNKVDLLVKVHYETVIFTLPSDLKPIPNWQESLMHMPGMTHYVRSIQYGGDLIASVRFTTQNEGDKELIKAEIQGELNSQSGSFGGGLKGNLDKIKNKVGDTASMDINYYATVPLENVPRTIQGLTDLVEKFPEQTKKVNDGYGVPLSMEVFSLEGLKKDYVTYYQTLALADQMVILDEQFTDIRQAKIRLADWLKTVPPVLAPEENDKIGEFQTKLDTIDRLFGKTIANLDLAGDATGEQFKPAFEAYQGSYEESVPSMYVKLLSKLKKEILDNTPSFEADFGGDHYDYWGSDSCPKETVQVFNGTMSTTDSTSSGSSQFVCLPVDTQFAGGDGQKSQEDIEDLPQVKPVAFISRKKGTTETSKMVKCSTCRVPGKSAATTLIGKTSCPGDWVKQYEGTLISTDFQQLRGQLVCLDTSKSLPDLPKDVESPTELTEVSPKCGSFPCPGGYTDGTALPCVVCSVTKKTTSVADVLRL